MFQLHPRLQADTVALGDYELCRVLLMNDARYPWVILVPRRADISEPFELEPDDQQALHAESLFTSRALAAAYPNAKLNVASLGNVVRQLHVHHVVRTANDAAWPGPVWGHSAPTPYAADALERAVNLLRASFAERLRVEGVA